MKDERTGTTMTELRGGKGDVVMRHVAGGQENLPTHYRLLCECVIEKGNSIGLHPHIGESEVYYVVKGEATVTDPTGTRKLYPGDVEICFDGEEHTVSNEQDEPMMMLCVVITND